MTRALFFAMIMAAMTFFLIPSGSMLHAQTTGGSTESPGSPAKRDLSTVDSKGSAIRCADLPAAKGGVLLGYIIPCMVHTIQDSTVTFTTKMIELLKPAFFAFIVFAVTMFGLKIVQGGGGQELGKDAFVLLIKIAFIVGMLEAIPAMVPDVYGIITSSQEIVTGVIGTDGIKCDIAKYKDGNTPLVWAQMDCLLGKLYGFTTGADSVTGAKQPNMLLAASVFGMMAGFFFGGTLGVALFLVLIGVLWSIFMLVVKTALAFINGYLIVCLMLIISPLFLPLVLLRATGQYFDQWWKLILGGILLPVIVTAYAMFAMLLYDRMLFADDALIKDLFQYKNVQDAQQPSTALCDKQVTGLSSHREKDAGLMKKLMENPFMQSMTNVLSSGGNNLCAGVKATKLQLNKIKPGSKEFEDEKAAFTKLFTTAIKLLILAILIEEGLKTLVGNIRTLVPTSAPTASIGERSGGKIDEAIQGRMAAAKQGLTDGFTRDRKGNVDNAAGATFLARTPEAFKRSISGLINPRGGE